MGSQSLILVLIIFAITVDVSSAKGTVRSFRRCIVRRGLSPDLVVDHYTGNSTLYEKLDHRWNVRPVHTHPLAYFVPRFASDVQIAVRCARENRIPVIPKSGGHSAELLAFGNAGTIIIAFQNMKKIVVNAIDKTAVIEPGALLSEIRQKLLDEGGFGLSTGVCDDVGIGGIALGGGDGYVTPNYNLTVDNILEMKMVDSNGDLHLVNKNVNSDLFWALRGVGSGYIGIVTSFKFKLFNATDLRITNFTFTYELESIGPVLLAYQDWLLWVEEEGVRIRNTLGSRGKTNRVSMAFVLNEKISSGPSNAGLVLQKALETFPPPLEGQEVSLTFPSYEELPNDEEDISVNIDAPTYVKKKSLYVNRTFTAQEFEKHVQMIHRSKDLYVQVFYIGISGLFHKIPVTEMSFVHRSYFYFVTHRVVAGADVSAEEAQLALDWLDEFDKEYNKMDNGQSYQNYVDLDLSDRFMERYYGQNAKRLMKIKKKWDRHNYFQNEQSIPIK